MRKRTNRKVWICAPGVTPLEHAQYQASILTAAEWVEQVKPVQTHKAIMQQLWPLAKSMVMAGHRMVLELRPEKRSTPQNRKLWAMLGEIAAQVEWHGQRLPVPSKGLDWSAS